MPPPDVKNTHLLITREKLIFSSKRIFHKELENIKETLINNRFPNYIVDKQIKWIIKNAANKINTATLHPINKHLSNFLL